MLLLKLTNVFKSFTDDHHKLQVLDNISLTVEQGEIICILGPSGCGKTTLLNIIAGIETPTQGLVVLGSIGKVGYVPQRDFMLPWRTVLQNITLSLELTETITRKHLDTISNLAEHYGIGEFLTTYPDMLSGGMKQVVSFIRTSVIEPSLFLFDEPFASIDYDLRLRLEDDVVELITHTSKGAIFVTHNIEEAVAMADKIIVLSKRPAEIRAELKVGLANECGSATNARLAPAFREHLARVLNVLRHE